MRPHAFVDKSRRGRNYLLAEAIVAPSSLAALRREMRGLLMPGQAEVHFKSEKEKRRRGLIDRIVTSAGVKVRIYVADCDGGQERARQRCLRQMVLGLVELRAQRLVFDSRKDGDVEHRHTLWQTLGRRSDGEKLTFSHVASGCEPLLWIADAVVWCYRAGGAWRSRVEVILDEVVEVDPSRNRVA